MKINEIIALVLAALGFMSILFEIPPRHYCFAVFAVTELLATLIVLRPLLVLEKLLPIYIWVFMQKKKVMWSMIYVLAFFAGIGVPILVIKGFGAAGFFTGLTVLFLIWIVSLFMGGADEQRVGDGQHAAEGGTIGSVSSFARKIGGFALRAYASSRIAGGNEGVTIRQDKMHFGKFLVRPPALEKEFSVLAVPSTYVPVFINPLVANDRSDAGWGTGTDGFPPEVMAAIPESLRRFKAIHGPRAVVQIRGMWEILYYAEMSDQPLIFSIKVTTEGGLEVTLKVLLRARVHLETDGSLPIERARLLASHLDQRHEDYLCEVLTNFFLSILTSASWEERVIRSTDVVANADAICDDVLPLIGSAADEIGLEIDDLKILSASDVSGKRVAEEAERVRILASALGGGSPKRGAKGAAPAPTGSGGIAGATPPASPSAGNGEPVDRWAMVYSLATMLIEKLGGRGGGGGTSGGGGSSS